MSRLDAITLAYIVAMVSFIVSLRFLSSPARARYGTWVGAAGMAIAIAATLFQPGLRHVGLIVAVMAVSAPAGAYAARKVRLTAMPQMVALFNGLGGGAAALIAVADVHHSAQLPGRLPASVSVSIALSAVIGATSFAGSMVAFAKLAEVIGGRPIIYRGQKAGNLALLAALVAGGAVFVLGPQTESIVLVLAVGALAFGVLFVLPIGGADMPVVISLLNALTGVAASATGFVLHQNVLIVSGMLVGASGTLLTMMMARAMGRSITNVLFGAFGTLQPGAGAASPSDGAVRSATADDVAIMLAYARTVVIAPGYGMAVAQAQSAVHELELQLEARGIDVKFAIHPVAGRMPGHMNVLLAEADVPYDRLREMDDINPQFDDTDVVLVVGANDVTNPRRAYAAGEPDLRHADPRRGPRPQRCGAEAQHEPGICRYRQPAVHRAEHADAVRRCEDFG